MLFSRTWALLLIISEINTLAGACWMWNFLVGKSVSGLSSHQRVLLALAKPRAFGLSAGSKQVAVGVMTFVCSFSSLRCCN